MGSLTAQIEETAGSGTWVDAGARLTNQTGTPVVSATANDDGQLIADTYTLTFASVVAGTSATVKTAANNPNNPNIDQTGKSINLDDTTIYKNVIRGISLVFDNAGGFTNSWQAQVRAGHSFGSVASFGSSAGVGGSGRRIRVKNTGSDQASGCLARLLPCAKLWKKTGTVFERVRPFAEDAVEKLTGDQIVPYAITVLGVSGSGAAKTMDFRVDGSPVDVLNLTTNVEAASEDLNVVDYYRVVSGDLSGLEFILSQSAVNSDAANILIFEPANLQIAPDESGSPGTYGVSDVTLTESGQDDGVIRALGFAYFWLRTLVPEGASSESNPFVMDVALSGSISSAAGWTS